MYCELYYWYIWADINKEFVYLTGQKYEECDRQDTVSLHFKLSLIADAGSWVYDVVIQNCIHRIFNVFC